MATTDTLTNKTLTSPVISTISNTGTITLPTSTDTLIGRATTDTLTNKTLTSPVLTTPNLGTPSTLVLTNATGLPAAQLTGTQTIPRGTLPTGSVLQVVQGTYSTEVTTTSTSYVTSGLNASITPSSSTSKVLIIVSNVIRANSLGDCNWTVFRGTVSGTNLAGSGYFVYGTATAGSSTVVTGISITYLDSPATTSATTYTLGFKSSGVSVNSQHGSTTATITLMEIAA